MKILKLSGDLNETQLPESCQRPGLQRFHLMSRMAIVNHLSTYACVCVCVTCLFCSYLNRVYESVYLEPTCIHNEPYMQMESWMCLYSELLGSHIHNTLFIYRVCVLLNPWPLPESWLSQADDWARLSCTWACRSLSAVPLGSGPSSPSLPGCSGLIC